MREAGSIHRPFSERGLHVLAKPIGPRCNLRCEYCFYRVKEELYADETEWRMSDATLDAFVRQYVEAQPEDVSQIDFAFQGGEPTLLGIDFFRHAVARVRHELRSRAGLNVTFSLQTNGLLLDDLWCEFLKEQGFLVGLSVDGPGPLHDRYRRDAAGRGTFERVASAIGRLQRHGVEFNALVSLHRQNASHPSRVYRFFRERNVHHLQFIPIVEPIDRGERTGYLKTPEQAVSPRSVLPKQYGDFLTAVFDAWVRQDVGRVFIRDFDHALSVWVGAGATLCVHSKECGRALVVEHNGDLYACDHYVDRDHRRGNIHQRPIRQLANLPSQEAFGRSKFDSLPTACLDCPWLAACHGGCPKDRVLGAGEKRLNYLCAGYKQFFSHIAPLMDQMAQSLRAGRPPAEIMRRLRAAEAARRGMEAGRPPGRNDPCPCGSGKKHKQCCLRR